MLHIPLEVPLLLLAVARLGERDDTCVPRVEMLHEPLDRAALANGVAALEQQHVLGLSVVGPVLELQQLDLQQVLQLVVVPARHPLVIRVVLPPRVDRAPVGCDQDGVVVVVLADRVTLDVEVAVDVLTNALHGSDPRYASQRASMNAQRGLGPCQSHGSMNRSTAVAKPSSWLDVVTRRAARWTSWPAFPIAMLRPEWANMSTSLGMSPIVAI